MTPENNFNSKHFDIYQIQTLKSLDKHKSFALFHIKARSLKKIDDLDHLFQCTNELFDIVAFIEIRITKKNTHTTN